MNAERLGEKIGWCKCDKWTIFAGHKCMPKNHISGKNNTYLKIPLINKTACNFFTIQYSSNESIN